MEKRLILRIALLCIGVSIITAIMVVFLSKNTTTSEMEFPDIASTEASAEPDVEAPLTEPLQTTSSLATVDKPDLNRSGAAISAADSQPKVVVTPADNINTKFDESTLRPIPGSDSYLTPDQAEFPGIMCWGDSLTVGYMGVLGGSYPDLLNKWLAQDGYHCDVVNMGATGEDSRAIAARCGGVDMLNKDDTIVQADLDASDIAFVDKNGKPIRIQLYDSVGVNPCYVVDENGNNVEVEVYNYDIYTGYANYTIKAYEEGHLITMPAGTKITPYGATIHPDYLKIIYSGNNGGFDDMQEYIDQIDGMIKASGYGEFYIVIGITLSDVVDFNEYDQVMQAAYGDHYLNFRQYLADYDYTSLGYSPSESDRECYRLGDYSPWMMAGDNIHFNETTYSILAQAVYEKLYSLGYNNAFYTK